MAFTLSCRYIVTPLCTARQLDEETTIGRIVRVNERASGLVCEILIYRRRLDRIFKFGSGPNRIARHNPGFVGGRVYTAIILITLNLIKNALAGLFIDLKR